MQSYMVDHPELKNMITDYVKNILHMKPSTVIDYTINYFLQFIPEYWPRNEYFEEVEEEIFQI